MPKLDSREAPLDQRYIGTGARLRSPIDMAHGHHGPTQAAPLRAGQIRHIRHRGGDQLVFLVPVSGHVVAVRVSFGMP